MLEVRELSKAFGDGGSKLQVLNSVNFGLRAGESLAVLGPSGCGKSTLISCLAGLLNPDSGQIIFEQRDLARLSRDAWTEIRAKKIGVIFQQFHLVGHLNALENVRLPLDLAGIPDAQAEQRAAEALAQVGLSARATHLPSQLSRGESQRVAIARVLVNRPQLILADEPTASLDRVSAKDAVDRLLKITRDAKVGLIMVTHDPEFAALCDRQVKFRDGTLDFGAVN
jgi:putative ABC transport system ATP-binding protein